ncbi:hypothetical protein, partial [Gilliamella apicola]|uniref:hypothetical protein n=1 Tax=Gilliamella apicola TaxID=1196095 RepID=UPI0010423AC7
MVLVLTVVVLLSISFTNHALTTKTTNVIQGSAPYLTFDGGRTRATNTDGLLGITLSNGVKFTPTTNNSSFDNPIVLPAIGQSFNDIGMLVPTDTNSIALSSLIGTPYNYWGDDDGDGQGIDGITATGSLNLSIVDKDNQAVERNEVLDICKAPYKLTLSNTKGTLKTRYGMPNESRFSASNVIYYINPKAKVSPVICFAKPGMKKNSSGQYAGPASIWDAKKGFLPQSITPSSYDLNFPTTGANNLYFDLEIAGVAQPLKWEAVSPNGDIKATMTNLTKTNVRVKLTGPIHDKPSLPQVFELVGKDSDNNDIEVRYGFVLKQWFVTSSAKDYQSASSMCTKIGYRMP